MISNIKRALTRIKKIFTLYKVAMILGFLVLFSFFYLYNIGTFVPTNTQFETLDYLSIKDHNQLISNISLFPIKLLQYISIKLQSTEITFLRSVSVLFIFASLSIFYKVIYTWRESNRMAIISTFMLGTSSYLLHIGHLASSSAIYLAVIPTLIMIGIWLKTKKSINHILFAMPIIILLLYIPGIWFIIATLAIIFRKRLILVWKFAPRRNLIGGIIASIIAISPLVYSLIINPSQITQLLGVDRLTNQGTIAVLDVFKLLPDQLFWHGLNQPQSWLYGTAVIDFASVIFMILGIVAYKNSTHTLRVKLIILLSLLSCIVLSLSSLASIALILPIIYLIIGRGIAYALQNWFAVFPLNPIARRLGITALMIPILLISYNNYQKYFNAWRNAPATIKVLK